MTPKITPPAVHTPTATIRCLPKGICSWHFDLTGDQHRGTLELSWVKESGSISINEMSFDIQKHGIFSGHWTLRHDGNEVASAKKTSAFTRTFELEDPAGKLLLSAESAFQRSFHLQRDGEVVARMFPDHPFTRRAKIEIAAQDWDAPIIYFSFWLVVLMWRRASQNNNSG